LTFFDDLMLIRMSDTNVPDGMLIFFPMT